jgi:MerR family transcriptional regulator, redox-sensitive transcriptional activator SoxR
MNEMSEMTIGEVAQRAGIRASTLRYYERKGLLSAPLRVNGQRRYDDTILQTLALIHIAQQAGFTIAEIRLLLHTILGNKTASSDWQMLARRKLQEVDRRLTHIQSMKRLLEEVLNCDYPELAECIYDVGQKHGVVVSDHT